MRVVTQRGNRRQETFFIEDDYGITNETQNAVNTGCTTMHVKIIAVSGEQSRPRVQFDTGIGIGVATWSGQIIPREGKEVDVEIDIDERIDFSQNAQVGDQDDYGVSHYDKNVVFRGLIEDQDDDGMSYLRIAPDCLVMIESEEHSLKGTWLRLEVSMESVRITPIGA